ncbi:unnamed protein product [Trichobilharzia regenti]|nr:unnamed protein product [Trichobilharzia regenti]
MRFDVNLYNVVITGLAFFFLFVAFQTASLTAVSFQSKFNPSFVSLFLQQNALEAVFKQSNHTFDDAGYTSQIVGGLYAYISLSNTTEISKTLRVQLYGGLLGCAIFGILLLFLLKKPRKVDSSDMPSDLERDNISSSDELTESYSR